MAFFNFQKNKNKEEANQMAKIDDVLQMLDGLSEDEKKRVRDKLDGKESTTEQIEKAEEHIAEKGADSQSEKDRIDESVAAQERAEGDKDKQSAKDRVDEAIGEDKHLEKEDDKSSPDIAAIREEMRELKAMVAALSAKPQEVKDDDMKSKLDKVAARYLN